MCIYIYIYVCMYLYICICIYMYIQLSLCFHRGLVPGLPQNPQVLKFLIENGVVQPALRIHGYRESTVSSNLYLYHVSIHLYPHHISIHNLYLCHCL